MNVTKKNTKNTKLEKVVYCHDCGKEIKNIIIDEENQKILGAKFYERNGNWYAKDLKCYAADPVLRNFQDSECFTRVVGFLRPVQQFNKGKVAEYSHRKIFSTKKALEK